MDLERGSTALLAPDTVMGAANKVANLEMILTMTLS
jgi:hypothetical protein